MAKTASTSSPQKRFDVFPVWSTKNVKFKQKYQQYGQCLQTTLPFLMTMNKHLEGEYLNAISDVNVRDGKNKSKLFTKVYLQPPNIYYGAFLLK